jgi:hypothetical protein
MEYPVVTLVDSRHICPILLIPQDLLLVQQDRANAEVHRFSSLYEATKLEANTLQVEVDALGLKCGTAEAAAEELEGAGDRLSSAYGLAKQQASEAEEKSAQLEKGSVFPPFFFLSMLGDPLMFALCHPATPAKPVDMH